MNSNPLAMQQYPKSFANLMEGLSPSSDLVQRYRQQHNQVLLVLVMGLISGVIEVLDLL